MEETDKSCSYQTRYVL